MVTLPDEVGGWWLLSLGAHDSAHLGDRKCILFHTIGATYSGHIVLYYLSLIKWHGLFLWFPVVICIIISKVEQTSKYLEMLIFPYFSFSSFPYFVGCQVCVCFTLWTHAPYMCSFSFFLSFFLVKTYEGSFHKAKVRNAQPVACA